jgi:hypothetical protein
MDVTGELDRLVSEQSVAVGIEDRAGAASVGADGDADAGVEGTELVDHADARLDGDLAVDAGGEELVTGDFGIITKDLSGLRAPLFDAADVGAVVDSDAFGSEAGFDDRGDDGVLAGDHAIRALDDGDAEAREDLTLGVRRRR